MKIPINIHNLKKDRQHNRQKKNTKEQRMIYKRLHRKQKIESLEPHHNRGWTQVSSSCSTRAHPPCCSCYKPGDKSWKRKILVFMTGVTYPSNKFIITILCVTSASSFQWIQKKYQQRKEENHINMCHCRPTYYVELLFISLLNPVMTSIRRKF